jgi:hypothetical protein
MSQIRFVAGLRCAVLFRICVLCRVREIPLGPLFFDWIAAPVVAGIDPMFAATIVTTAFLSGVTRRPLLSVAILLLCFPLIGILWSGLAAIVGGALPISRMLLEVEE